MLPFQMERPPGIRKALWRRRLDARSSDALTLGVDLTPGEARGSQVEGRGTMELRRRWSPSSSDTAFRHRSRLGTFTSKEARQSAADWVTMRKFTDGSCSNKNGACRSEGGVIRTSGA